MTWAEHIWSTIRLIPEMPYLFANQPEDFLISRERRTVADHLDQLRDVFTRLKNAGLTLKPSKCHLLQMEGFAQVAAPLNALTNKGKEWMWTADCTHAFLELKKRLVSTPVLVMPQFTQEFILDTDASGEGLGAVLSQVIEGLCCVPIIVLSSGFTTSKNQRDKPLVGWSS
eukprot:Em0003g1331a